MKKFNKNFLSILILLVLIALGGCSRSDDIDLVKNGVLEFDQSLTVGEAFENYKYFKKVKWEAFKTENGRRVVQVTGSLDLEKYPLGREWKQKGIKNADVIFQFLILKDNKHFQLYTYGIRLVFNNGTEKILDASDLGLTRLQMLRNLKEIYDNEPLS